MKIESGHLDKAPECRSCGTHLDGFTGVGDAEKPKDGDLSVCAYCGAVGKFANGLSSLEELTPEEINEIKADEELWRTLSSIKTVAARYRESKQPDIVTPNQTIQVKDAGAR